MSALSLFYYDPFSLILILSLLFLLFLLLSLSYSDSPSDSDSLSLSLPGNRSVTIMFGSHSNHKLASSAISQLLFPERQNACYLGESKLSLTHLLRTVVAFFFKFHKHIKGLLYTVILDKVLSFPRNCHAFTSRCRFKAKTTVL